ncbi:MAG: cardiolipin synthase [Marinicellaceae bacterium]
MGFIPLILIIVDILIILVLIPTIILQRRESGATFAWILTIILLPYIGLLLFWIFGTKKLHIKRRKRHQVESKISSSILDFKNKKIKNLSLKEIPHSLINLATKLDEAGPLRGNKVKLYRSGVNTFNDIEEAILSSINHIHFVYYIWEKDKTGQRIINALIQACERGVEVRVLVDGLGSYSTNNKFFEKLINSGGIVERFFPINILGRHFNLNYRNHRKIIIIDGHTGFTGGMNIGDDYAGIGQPWLDLHARIRGSAVASLQEVFCQDWFHVTGQDLTHPKYFTQVENIGNTWVQVLSSGPADERWKNIHTLLFASINSAEKNIWIETPYFIPDSAIIMALQTAALKGVDVRLLLPSKSDHRLVLHAGRSFLMELMYAGVRVFEVQNAMPHAKMVTIDSHFSSLGSANMDQRSFRLNFETNVFFYGKNVAKKLETDFTKACKKEAIEIFLKDRKSIGLYQKLAEGIGRVFAPLL